MYFFFFFDLIFRLVKLALNSQPVLSGQMATTQEFQASTPQERKQYNLLIGGTEQPLFAPFINIDQALNDLMDAGGVYLI